MAEASLVPVHGDSLFGEVYGGVMIPCCSYSMGSQDRDPVVVHYGMALVSEIGPVILPGE